MPTTPVSLHAHTNPLPRANISAPSPTADELPGGHPAHRGQWVVRAGQIKLSQDDSDYTPFSSDFFYCLFFNAVYLHVNVL